MAAWYPDGMQNVQSPRWSTWAGLGLLLCAAACSSTESPKGAATQTSNATSNGSSVAGSGGAATANGSGTSTSSSAATGGANNTGGSGGTMRSGQIRVHLIASSIDDLDGAGTFASEAEQKAALDGFLQHINLSFAVANITWSIESIRSQPALNEGCYQKVIDGEVKGGVCLRQNVDPTAMLAPKGWDMFVVKRTSALGFGGVYVCSVNGDKGMGAFFVPWKNANGGPQAKRKWSHELGHAMGLPHTPCEPAYANHLMMSGNCSHAVSDRKNLDKEELKRVDIQYQLGGPAACGTLKLDYTP